MQNQKDKDRAKAQALRNRDKTDKYSKPKRQKNTPQLEDNWDIIDITNNPTTQMSKGKVNHPDQIKSSKKGKKTSNAHNTNRVPNNPDLNPDIHNEDNLIADDAGEYDLHSDEIYYTFFFEGAGNPPDLMGIDDEQLLAIQNDLRERLKAKDEARERTASDKLCKLEWKHEYANSEFLKHFSQVSELLELTAKGAQARVKLADKMLILPSLLDGE